MAEHRRSNKRRAGTAAVATVAVGVLAAAGIGRRPVFVDTRGASIAAGRGVPCVDSRGVRHTE